MWKRKGEVALLIRTIKQSLVIAMRRNDEEAILYTKRVMSDPGIALPSYARRAMTNNFCSDKQ